MKQRSNCALFIWFYFTIVSFFFCYLIMVTFGMNYIQGIKKDFLKDLSVCSSRQLLYY